MTTRWACRDFASAFHDASMPHSSSPRSPLALVIDDHADSRTIARIVLESAGFRVTDTPTGDEGLRVAVALRPRVVLLDMILPGLDGWEIARRLRSDPRTSRCIIVALTALVGLRDHDRARLAGCDEVLIKPVRPRAIVSAISELIALPAHQA